MIWRQTAENVSTRQRGNTHRAAPRDAQGGNMKACRVVSLACVLALAPAWAWAQAASGIAGVVKDSSGAVMPGVTVEAASDALIEKVRSVVSDEHGEYKIIDLRPGTY